MNLRAASAIAMKDLKTAFRSRMVIVPILITPLVMIAVLPLALFLGLHSTGTAGINGLDMMMKNFPGGLPFADQKRAAVFLAINYLFPAFFLLIPVMAASILGAASFVSEKEHRTLETLFYAPVGLREIFLAKAVGTFIPAYLVTLLSFLIFGAVVDVSGWLMFHEILFPNLKWILVIAWVSPAVTILAIMFMVLISSRVQTSQEAQQMVTFIVIPFVLLLVGQTTGLFMLSEWLLLLGGAGIFGLDAWLFLIATRHFIPEKML
jgi:ABC-type transport system involved in multi-copper enzyme maturation permease subunit